MGARVGRVFRMGQQVHVLLDRIDRQQRRLQFALLPVLRKMRLLCHGHCVEVEDCGDGQWGAAAFESEPVG